jgi:hypothetical protein
MKRVALVLVAIGAGVVGWTFAHEALGGLRDHESNPGTVDRLLRIASGLNKNTPMMVDSETEWMNTGAEEGVIIYNYRLVHVSQSSVSAADLRAAAMHGITNAACTTPQTRTQFLDRGIAMRYSYYDQARHLITSFDITQAMCKAR